MIPIFYSVNKETIGFDGRPVAVFAGGRNRRPGYDGEVRGPWIEELMRWAALAVLADLLGPYREGRM